MEGDRKNICSAIEDPLGPVAVMHVDIQNGDPPGAPITAVLSGDGGVVQKAEAAGLVGEGMMSGGRQSA
jgi:hypothetical protein